MDLMLSACYTLSEKRWLIRWTYGKLFGQDMVCLPPVHSLIRIVPGLYCLLQVHNSNGFKDSLSIDYLHVVRGNEFVFTVVGLPTTG